MNEVMVGIVTYNPDIYLLYKNINAVAKLGCRTYIIDNGSKNVDRIRSLTANFCKDNDWITLICNVTNLGIASALNSLMRLGDEQGYKWVLTLDQDSIVPDDIIFANQKLLCRDNRIAIISPVVRDRNVIHRLPQRGNKTYTIINKVITSGSITSVEIWKRLGGFDEYMFIDYVDIDYSLRAVKEGYLCPRNNTVEISHAIGHAREVRFFGRWIPIMNHCPFRYYFQVRNWIYIHKKLYGGMTVRAWKNIVSAYYRDVFYEKRKFRKFLAISRGIIDGIRVDPRKM